MSGNQVSKVSSLDSTSSVASTSSQRLTGPSFEAGREQAATAAVTTSYGRHLSDICAVLIHCPKHERFALVKCHAHHGLWFPYVSLKQSEGWYAATVNKIRQLLGVKIGVKSSSVFTPPEIMHVMRIQLPEVLKYVTRVVFMTSLQSAASVASPSAAYAASSGKVRANEPAAGGGPKFECHCEDNDDSEGANTLRWLRHEAIVQEEEQLEIWGPEPGMFTSVFATSSVERGAYSEYTLREAIRFQPREQQTARTHQEEMLSSCRFERADILRLYSDYVQHCFPSQNMNYVSFCDYLTRLGYEHSPAGAAIGGGTMGSPQPAASKLNAHDFRALYRAFKLNRLEMPYLTFHELLLGLAAMDRNTAHGGHSGELRCGYIFRYYDTNSDGQLSVSELRQMAYDRLRVAQVKRAQSMLRAGKRQTPAPSEHQHQQRSNSAGAKSTSGSLSARAIEASLHSIDNELVKKELAHIYQQLNLKYGESISEMSFMLAVGSMQLRGTSTLFRSQMSVLPVKQHYERIVERHALTDIEGNLIGGELKRKGTCPRCKEKSYTLALHTVKLTQDAQIVEPMEVRFDEYPAPIGRAQRQNSRLTFASDHLPNKLIDMITTYWNSLAASSHHQHGGSASGPAGTGAPSGGSGAGSAAGGGGTPASGSGQTGAAPSSVGAPLRMLAQLNGAVPLGKTSWERMNRKALAEDIKRLCQQAERVFKQEARVVGVTSPCYVLGDIHGNLNDLRIYERILWPGAPACLSGSYLFLGDYVDRGDHGLECICYLLCMKILAPESFFLLRGNHEIRSIQQAFTFFREVNDKFHAHQLGTQVWESLNKVFDLMPVAATIDDQIFCAHGGIPTSALRLDELMNIPTPLGDPENQSPAAWEILWNDPVSSTEYTEYADLLRKQPGGQQAMANMQGYLPNTKRGTAFFFSEEAVKRFLRLNGLSHIIRAHECVPPGYTMHCNGKVITVFSSSHYCGATNDAACILVERERLRVIRLDTD